MLQLKLVAFDVGQLQPFFWDTRGGGLHRLATHSAIRRTRLPGPEAEPH